MARNRKPIRTKKTELRYYNLKVTSMQSIEFEKAKRASIVRGISLTDIVLEQLKKYNEQFPLYFVPYSEKEVLQSLKELGYPISRVGLKKLRDNNELQDNPMTVNSLPWFYSNNSGIVYNFEKVLGYIKEKYGAR